MSGTDSRMLGFLLFHDGNSELLRPLRICALRDWEVLQPALSQNGAVVLKQRRCFA